MNHVERKKNGLPYRYDDPALLGDQHIYQDKMEEYNRTLPTQTGLRQRLLREMFAEIGEFLKTGVKRVMHRAGMRFGCFRGERSLLLAGFSNH